MYRSIRSLTGYVLGATDGNIGKVEQFYFDDQTWKICDMLVETGNWFNGNEVIISLDSLIKTRWEPGILPVALTKNQVSTSPDLDTVKPVSRLEEDENSGKELHLSGIDEICNYGIRATDGDIGSVKDFIMNDETWQLEYMVIEIRHWFRVKKILIATSHITKVDWEHSIVFVDINIASIKERAAFDVSAIASLEQMGNMHYSPAEINIF
jgi:uncharacterized protein YrrD